MSFLLDWNPGIGDRERGAQPLVEFSRRLSAVPSAPGERACFVFGAGRDHQAQSGLGVLDVPVLSLWRVRRHGDLPCGVSLRHARASAIASMRSWIRAGVHFDQTPAYRRTALSMRPPPSRRFLPRPPASAPSLPIAPRRREPLPRYWRIGSTCPIGFRRRLQRQLHGEVCGEGVAPPARWRRREGLSGAARSDSGGYRINGM